MNRRKKNETKVQKVKIGHTMTTIEATNQLQDIIKPAMETESSISRTSTSNVKRLITLPNGVVSKYDNGAPRTLVVIAVKSFSAHLAPP